VTNVKRTHHLFIDNGKIIFLENEYRIFLFSSSWGIRQISGFTIGDWKYSKVENPVWHKMALTWPVDGGGTMIPVS
jgi:hypothetical protein